MASTLSLPKPTPIGSWADAVDSETNSREKTITEVKVDPITGNKVYVHQTLKMITERIPKSIADRRKWAKFGKCKDAGNKLEPGITMVGDEVELEFVRTSLGEQKHDEENETNKNIDKGTFSAHCHNCKISGHWSKDCPFKSTTEEKFEDIRSSGLKGSLSGGKYVAPQRTMERAGMGERRSDEFTVRVTNLPEDFADLDNILKSMFSSIGRIDRFFLAKDKATNLNKGFAFITYTNKNDAERAIARFNKFPFESLIINVEFARTGRD
uniref:Eukaryotic translation initiation factor 3 subunit G n=1 Tax=Parastrongyloides trichosuri TaxID=131310 RepID=A0A0N4ZRP2_PARTI